MTIGTDRELREAHFNHSLANMLQKLNQTLQNEMTYLESGRQEKLEKFAKEKMQLFSQLNTIRNANTSYELTDMNKTTLEKLDSLLQLNMEKLQFRIRAIDEIANTIEAAVRDGESDGTYEAGNFRAALKA